MLYYPNTTYGALFGFSIKVKSSGMQKYPQLTYVGSFVMLRFSWDECKRLDATSRGISVSENVVLSNRTKAIKLRPKNHVTLTTNP